MSEAVSWVFEARINDGALEDFKAMTADMVAATKANEPGTLAYEWFISDDGASCHVYERYADNDAAATHLKWFGANGAPRFMKLASATAFTFYGNPDDAVRALLKPLGAKILTPIDGFHR